MKEAVANAASEVKAAAAALAVASDQKYAEKLVEYKSRVAVQQRLDTELAMYKVGRPVDRYSVMLSHVPNDTSKTLVKGALDTFGELAPGGIKRVEYLNYLKKKQRVVHFFCRFRSPESAAAAKERGQVIILGQAVKICSAFVDNPPSTRGVLQEEFMRDGGFLKEEAAALFATSLEATERAWAAEADGAAAAAEDAKDAAVKKAAREAAAALAAGVAAADAATASPAASTTRSQRRSAPSSASSASRRRAA